MFTPEEIEILRGPQGPAGKDAYEQAVANGFLERLKNGLNIIEDIEENLVTMDNQE